VNSDAPAVLQARRSQAETAEQWGAAGLIAVDALIRTLTALVLLAIRRKGPGLWWSAVCVTLALGAVVGPSGLLVGGVAGPASVASETWGQLLLAVELLILFRAFDQGRARALFGLVPLFCLWANVDESFLVGLLLLAAAVVGSARPRKPRKGTTRASRRAGGCWSSGSRRRPAWSTRRTS
jgi:hypothetical protein